MFQTNVDFEPYWILLSNMDIFLNISFLCFAEVRQEGILYDDRIVICVWTKCCHEQYDGFCLGVQDSVALYSDFH